MSQFQVIARKWRPQSFQDLVGQDHISTTLLNALRGDRLPQALLFTGVRGTGKTSAARILAKSLRCTNSNDFVPCGVCRDCIDIAASRAIDVVEIDGASNNGVDAIRELRDSVGYMPSSGRNKIYIIDEVHMLSTAAFNALLKTLEEPPAHVVFVLATTEAQKIPNTILSRCQRFDFRRIPSRQIAEHLTKICETDGVVTSPDALWSIARQADGSMRDSQSLLDQVITFSNKEITLQKVIEVLGLTDRQLVIDGVTSLILRDPSMALALVEKVNRSGVDPKIFAQDLLEEIRNALMVRLCVDDPARIVDLPDSEIQALGALAARTSEEDLHTLFDMMLKGVNDLLRSSDPRLVLEMTLLRISSSPSMVALRDLFAGRDLSARASENGSALSSTKVDIAAESLSAPKVVVPPSFSSGPYASSTGSAARQSGNVALSESRASSHENGGALSSTKVDVAAESLSSTKAIEASATVGAGARSAASIAATSADAPKYTVDSFTRAAKPGAAKTTGKSAKPIVTALPPVATPASATGHSGDAQGEAAANEPVPSRAKDPWLHFVYMVRKSNGLLGAMLENTHILERSETKLVVGVPKKVAFVIDKLKDPDNVRRIETFVETIWEKRLKVEVKPGEATGESMTPRATQERAKIEKTQSIEAAVEQDPLVRTAKNVFKTQVKAIRDTDGPSAKRPK